jgi:hypothetical protein
VIAASALRPLTHDGDLSIATSLIRTAHAAFYARPAGECERSELQPDQQVLVLRRARRRSQDVAAPVKHVVAREPRVHLGHSERPHHHHFC